MHLTTTLIICISAATGVFGLNTTTGNRGLLGTGDYGAYGEHDATGNQVLYVGIQEEGYTFVKRGAPGADGPVLNHFDAPAVRRHWRRHG